MLKETVPKNTQIFDSAVITLGVWVNKNMVAGVDGVHAERN